MAVRLGINGFGRIGRYLVRLLAYCDDLPIAAINARADSATLAHLLKYDSVHGPFRGTVEHDDNGLIINGKHIAVTRCKTNEWIWNEVGADLVVETSGTIKTRQGLSEHLARGARKVIMSAPVPDADICIVMGVNDKLYDASRHEILSAASCTTNCLAPIAHVLHESFGIDYGMMTTIHSYTMSQRILDGSDKDIRRARAAGLSIIPTSTGAAKAIALVIPELAGRLVGTAVRVPTPNVSMIDLVCSLQHDVTVATVNAAFKSAAEGVLKENMGYSEEPLVSIDYNGDTHGGVVDALSTVVVGNRFAKILAWYDNEAGFTNQLLRLTRRVSASM